MGHGGDGDDAAVVEPLALGAEGAVDEDAVAGGVAALAGSPGGSGQFGAVDLAGRLEPATDPVGEVFAVGVGDGEGDDPGGSVGGDSATTVAARASRVACGEPRSCSHPWLRRMAWLVAMSPAR